MGHRIYFRMRSYVQNVTSFGASRTGYQYAASMIRRLLPNAIVVACVSLAWPSVAAEQEIATGLGNTGIGMFIIAVAAALLFTLLFRASATHVARIVTARIGRRRIRHSYRAERPSLV